MSIKLLNWGAFWAKIAGGGLAGLFALLALLDKADSVIILAAGVALISVASAVSSLLPAQAIVKDAPVTTATRCV